MNDSPSPDLSDVIATIDFILTLPDVESTIRWHMLDPQPLQLLAELEDECSDPALRGHASQWLEVAMLVEQASMSETEEEHADFLARARGLAMDLGGVS